MWLPLGRMAVYLCYLVCVYSNKDCYYLRQTKSIGSFVINGTLWLPKKQELQSNVWEFLLTACKCTTNDSTWLWVHVIICLQRSPPVSYKQCQTRFDSSSNGNKQTVFFCLQAFPSLSVRWARGGRCVTLCILRLARLLESKCSSLLLSAR